MRTLLALLLLASPALADDAAARAKVAWESTRPPTPYEKAVRRAEAGERVVVPKVPGRPVGKYLLWVEDGQLWHSRLEEAKREVPFTVPPSTQATVAPNAAGSSTTKPGEGHNRGRTSTNAFVGMLGFIPIGSGCRS